MTFGFIITLVVIILIIFVSRKLILFLFELFFKLFKVFIKGLFFLGLIVVIAIIWATVIEPNSLIVRKDVLYIPHWNSKLQGVRVALISDLHIGTRFSDLNKIQKIVKTTNEQKPDIIFLLGDYDTFSILSHKIDQNEIASTLGKLSAPYGVISVLGNHDVKDDKIIINILKKANIILLQDSYVRIKYHKTYLYVAGIKDFWHYKLRIKEVISSIPEKYPILLLTHNPDAFPKAPARISLTMAGHTHGGLITLPFVGSLFSPSDYFQRYVKSYTVEDNKHIYVTSGTGGSPGIRFNNPPEIVILTLQSQQYAKNPITNTIDKAGMQESFIPYYFKLKKYYKTNIRPKIKDFLD